MHLDENRWVLHNEWIENGRKFVEATCELCGEHINKIRKEALKGKNARQCLCVRPKIDRTPIAPGSKYGRLTVLYKDDTHKDGKTVRWFVECDCGTVKSLQSSSFKNGSVKSCGCYKEELLGRAIEQHGMSGTKEHSTWCGIVSRTQYECASTREWYYDKGIGMSDEWRKSFTKFYEDMGPCPEGFTIDRIDPAGDYCKENCRWASIELQSINKGRFKNNTSGTTGVSQTKTGSYVAYIYWKWERIHLGTFKTIEEAIDARKQAEEKYWSEVNE